MYSYLLFAVVCAVRVSLAFMVFEMDAAGSSSLSFRHESVPGHQLRQKPTDTSVCKNSEGVAGYLDIDDGDKHLFFWAFESQNDPLRDPVILWMTGGPGCSGTGVGALIELGPCRIEDVNTTIPNANAWNKNATVIFIDQPVNTGFSYSSEPVSNLADATEDSYNFLLLLFTAFQHLQALPLYIAGESYGGSWVPFLAQHIVKSQSPPVATLAQKTFLAPPVQITLKGISLGNAAISDTLQWKGFYPTGCLGASPLFNTSVCEKMASRQPHCDQLLTSCEASNQNPLICQPALDYCREGSVNAIFETGLNPYDFRKKCEGALCYPIIDTAAVYLNKPDVQEKLGVKAGYSFEQCNVNTSVDFLAAGDMNRPSAAIIGALLDYGLRVLIYAGNKDWFCNSAGMRLAANGLPWKGQHTFQKKNETDWLIDGTLAGSIKTTQELSFVEVYDAGHMVPMDKGYASLTLLNGWIGQAL